MKKRFQMKDLECANCAAKMEAAICKLEGVHSATMSFMTQKLTIDADESRFDAIMDQVEAICRKIEPRCTVKR